MPFDSISLDSLEWAPRPSPGDAPDRETADVTTAGNLTQSRARMWKYPPHTKGRRHIDPDQEEVFVPITGTLTVYVEDPPQRHDVQPGGAFVVHPGTPLQCANETDETISFFAYGAPPVTGNVKMLDE
jgi:quercetin dioxygenase-like cupin family protein